MHRRGATILFTEKAPTICSKRAFVKGLFGGKNKTEGGQQAAGGDDKSGGGMPGGFPSMPGMDPKRFQEFMRSSPEQQLELMKKGLEMQKRMGKNLPGFMKLSDKNVEFMENMVTKMETEQAAKKTTSSSSSSSGPASAPFGGSNTTATTSSASASTARGTKGPAGSGPTLDTLRKMDLGSEIEELFTELRTMREKRNYYRKQWEGREAELVAAKDTAQKAATKAEDLRKRLAAAEDTVRLMNTETMGQKEQADKLRRSVEENRRLKLELAALRGTDVAGLEARVSALQSEVTSAQEHERSLTRKLERMRRRDTLHTFSAFVGEVASGGFREGAAEVLRTEAERAALDDAFARLQEAHQSTVASAWEACRPAAAAALLEACRQRIAHWLQPHAALDAVAVVTDGGTALRAALRQSQLGFAVEPHPRRDDAVVVSAPANAESLGFGPYGHVFALMTAGDVGVSALHPYISATLAANERRARIDITTSRSSGPGGQATNVTETHMSAKLIIDGVTTATSESQDTRSALSNKKTATERVLGEGLEKHNRLLQGTRPGDLRPAAQQGDEPAGWADATATLAFLEASPVNAAVVQCARRLPQ